MAFGLALSCSHTSCRSYETAFRCIAFASMVYPLVAILGPISYISSAISVLFSTPLIIIASVEVHDIKKKTTYIVFYILGIIGLLTNINNEMAARRMATQAEDFAEQFKSFGDKMGNSTNMIPEEAGRAQGEFF